MRDGLLGEFPQIAAFARRVPSPRFAPASPLWGVVTGFGAAFFISAALLIVLTMLARILGTPGTWVGGVATAGATATALTVAYTVGGRSALIVYAGIAV